VSDLGGSGVLAPPRRTELQGSPLPGERPPPHAPGSAAAEDRALRLARAERLLVVLVALHSVLVGAFLILAPQWGARFGGFGAVTPLFFARQAGAFHMVVAAVYIVEHRRYGGVLLLVLTKAIAVAFLALTAALSDSPWVVPFSALGDLAMGAAAVATRRIRGLPLAGPGWRT
jgi:hypothetical protein